MVVKSEHHSSDDHSAEREIEEREKKRKPSVQPEWDRSPIVDAQIHAKITKRGSGKKIKGEEMGNKMGERKRVERGQSADDDRGKGEEVRGGIVIHTL